MALQRKLSYGILAAALMVSAILGAASLFHKNASTPRRSGLHVDQALLALNSDEPIRIEINAANSAEATRLRPLVEKLGGKFEIGTDHLMEFDIPAKALPALDQIPGDYAVVRAPQAERTFGHFQTQGVSAVGAPAWHALGYTGKDVRIGVIDLGFDGYDSSETAGCLQQVENFVPDMTLSQRGDHGTNVIEVICDMAPDAHVWAAQANTTSSLNMAIDWLISQNVNIINMSMRWDSVGVGDGTGEVNSMIQRAIDQGVLWVNAAGNSNGNTWDGTFNGVEWGDGTSSAGTYQDFDPSENADPINDMFWGQNITCESGYGVYVHAILRWSDWNDARTGNASGQDYNLYVFRSTDNGQTWEANPAAVSERDQHDNADFTPVEEIDTMLPCDYPNLHYGVAIRKENATGTEYMQLITWISGLFEYHSDRASISTPADSADTLTIAAGEVNNNFEIASYSSRGPVLGPGGTSPDGALYHKPDVTAPTNVTTSRLPSFDGTSAAAAHAAGFAALVYQHNRDRYESLSGVDRARAVKADIMDNLARPAPEDDPNEYGVGVLTTTSEYWWSTDKPIEENSGAIVRSGSGWESDDDPTASAGEYAYTTSTYAQIEFGIRDATGITINYWKRPEFAGTANVYVDGVLQGTLDLYAGTASTASITLSMPDTLAHRLDIRPAAGGVGLSLDSFQLSFPPQSGDYARQTAVP